MNINLLIRGFLYRENWTPISVRRKKIKNYTIDFLQCKDGYIDLIDKLKEKHNLSLYFSTYDTTPIHILQRIQREFNPKRIFISPEKNSSQFTTTIKGLSNLDCKEDLTIVLRGDLILKLKLIELIYNFNFVDNKLHVLTKERGRDRVIDVIHAVPSNIHNSFLNYISKPKLKHAHLIHKFIPCVEMSDENLCGNTDDCENFFRIYSPNLSTKNHQADTTKPPSTNPLIQNSKEKKIIYVDIDNTITNTTDTNYAEAIPIDQNILTINDLYKKGHYIVYWTARGSGSGIDYQLLTKNQLDSWGCLYHELKFNKPVYDLFIDDKALSNIQSISNI